MLTKFFARNNRGFTLVELLIVVAIIGVLSTIGVPTFRRMIQKSKKAEAKVNLGGLFTAESAFQAEYGAYGNNVAQLGFEIEGDINSLIYKVGFFTGGCNDATTIVPASTTTIGAQINSSFPKYYSSADFAASAGYSMNSNCYSGVTTTGVGTVYDSGSGATADAFTAVAAGVIRNGVNRATPGSGQTDVWTMTQDRVLANAVDGIGN